MRWAFVGGMADSIKADLDARKATEEEQRLWQQRMEMQEKIRTAAEEAQRKNRIINVVEDLNSGKLIETTAGGQRNETALPREYVEQQRTASRLAAEKERIEREREEKKFAAQLRKDDASISASEARAQASRATASLTPLRAEKLKADTERARREPTDDDKEAKRETEKASAKVEREVTAAYNTLKSNTALATAAQRIRFAPQLTPDEKLAALTELMEATE